MLHTSRVDVPALDAQSWQDGRVGARSGYYEETMNSQKIWLISSSGDHHTDLTSPEIDSVMRRFLAHFVKRRQRGRAGTPGQAA
ncbi:hypothetical protein [Nocardia sp. NPDC050793]|uniref:hypothetical protein n=1 Tax=Nocardia sp. NPDC050793 TaxID=3155159 RepID=UPI0033DF5833